MGNALLRHRRIGCAALGHRGTYHADDSMHYLICSICGETLEEDDHYYSSCTWIDNTEHALTCDTCTWQTYEYHQVEYWTTTQINSSLERLEGICTLCNGVAIHYHDLNNSEICPYCNNCTHHVEDESWLDSTGVAPTCMQEGYRTAKCKTCGNIYNIILDIDPEAHNYKFSATHWEGCEWHTQYLCDNTDLEGNKCNAEYCGKPTGIEHDWEELDEWYDSDNCIRYYGITRCKNCGNIAGYGSSTTTHPIICEHDMDTKTYTYTCPCGAEKGSGDLVMTTDKNRWQTEGCDWTAPVDCPYCGEENLTWVFAGEYNHNFSDGICTECGASDPDYEEECDHEWVSMSIYDGDDYYYDGTYWYDQCTYCTRCGIIDSYDTSYDSDPTDSSGGGGGGDSSEECSHPNMVTDNWLPSCTSTGMNRGYCPDCDYEYENEIPKTDHSWVHEETYTDINGNEYYVYVCSECGTSKEEYP